MQSEASIMHQISLPQMKGMSCEEVLTRRSSVLKYLQERAKADQWVRVGSEICWGKFNTNSDSSLSSVFSTSLEG